MKKEYESYNHAKVHIRYHLIFSTKFRRDCLNGIKEDLIECFNDIASHSHFKILNVGIDRNHVHFFIHNAKIHRLFFILAIFQI